MEDDVSNPFRRMSMRTRKIAPKMAAALASNDNRTQVSVFLLKRLKKNCFDQLKKRVVKWGSVFKLED